MKLWKDHSRREREIIQSYLGIRKPEDKSLLKDLLPVIWVLAVLCIPLIIRDCRQQVLEELEKDAIEEESDWEDEDLGEEEEWDEYPFEDTNILQPGNWLPRI